MELMQPKSDDPAQQQSNVILKVLPLMIGWFSLNVPAALSLYWVVNNIVTTGTSLIIRNNMAKQAVKPIGSSSAAASASSIFAPPRERPSGFGEAAAKKSYSEDVKPITPIEDLKAVVMDAEIVPEEADESGVEESAGSSKKRGGKKKRKKGN